MLIAVKRENTRHEIKERLEENLLHTIRVKNDDYRWIKPGKEIMVEGRMFDIKHYREVGSETEFTGLYDEEETALNQVADNLLHKQSRQKNMLLSQLVHLLQCVFFHPADESLAGFPVQLLFYPVGSDALPLTYYPIITPPPQL